MKIKTNNRPQGNVILAVLLTAFVVGLALSTYLTMISAQNQSTLRSQSWNSSVPAMEAGVEEALTALQYGNLAANRWTLSATDGFYHTTGSLRNGNSKNDCWYDVGIKLPPLGQPDLPVIEAVGYAPAPANLVTAADSRLINKPYGMILGGMLPIFRPDVAAIQRKVRVTARRDAIFSKAMAANGLIDMNGRFVLTDSFDSTDLTASTLGKYDSTKSKANGDVATNG